MLERYRFRFLNEVHAVESHLDWFQRDRSKLWLYNLHYFDDLDSEGAEGRADWHRAWIERWIAENSPGQGIGWEPYPASRRIVNWIKWALAGHALGDGAQQSLAIQARWLRKRLEWHLLANHLLANATALVFAGTVFDGAEADRWRYKGLDILSRQLPEQILSDGGHFERSPMYHAIVLEDLLDLINLAGVYPSVIPSDVVDGWCVTARRMTLWLLAMRHADGDIAFFNDAAFGIAAHPAQLEAYAKRLNIEAPAEPQGPVTVLGPSGYLRVDLEDMVALLDVASVGPDYQPGHAHADTLSFELSLFGHRVLVNSGTSLYAIGPERSRQRSTAAHSTLEVDGQNSSEVWAAFRVARRARPFGLECAETSDGVRIGCAHDGYKRLPGRVVHRREWAFENRSLQVIDRIDGRFTNAVARFHVYPDVKAEGCGDSGTLWLPHNKRVAWQVEGAEARVTPGRFHPEFGLSVPNACIEVTARSPTIKTTFDWS